MEAVFLFLRKVKVNGAELRKAFTSMQSDTSGVNSDQIHHILTQAGFQLPGPYSALFLALFNACDHNGTSRVTWSDFRTYFLNPLSSTSRVAKLEFAFKAFGGNSIDGKIRRKPFKELLLELCEFILAKNAFDFEATSEQITQYVCVNGAITQEKFQECASASPLALALLSFGTVHTKQTHSIMEQIAAAKSAEDMEVRAVTPPPTLQAPSSSVSTPSLSSQPPQNEQSGGRVRANSSQAHSKKRIEEEREREREEREREREREKKMRERQKQKQLQQKRQQQQRQQQQQQQEEEESEEDEEDDYEERLIQQIKRLQTELRKYMSKDKENEELMDVLQAELDRQKDENKKLRKRVKETEQEVRNQASQIEEVNQLQKENQSLKVKVKKLKRENFERNSPGPTRKKSDEEVVVDMQKEIEGLNLKMMDLKQKSDSVMQYLFAPPDTVDEEGFKPASDHKVLHTGWVMKEADIFSGWNRRLFASTLDGHLLWYAPQDHPKCRGSFDLRQTRTVVVGTREIPNQMILKNRDRTVSMWFADKGDMYFWLKSMRTLFPQKTAILSGDGKRIDLNSI
eukprot:CAMPEP_0201483898 /NCGR_PEP_ID=MMETSP0151_2-20130828/8086_1 /ASSEMBLY_ACC=CAM_ASM_000257 /TAXON_ID=200890 /ORGANISM="Paramoeba atlantica, Strain 621/1 / CCAP 1560/9" /LENGTH=570 /DNA_ID=CAMNT_0047867267 /DNA_START=198 /DNA_END=1910 /DNA_ORIENTATION=-